MQNVGQSENRNNEKVNVQLDVVKTSTPLSSSSSPAKSETETYSGAPANKYMTDSSESEDDSVSETEMEEEGAGADSKYLLTHEDSERTVDPEMQARLEALLEAAGIGKMSSDGKHLADPEVLRGLTSSVSCALDEAAAALTRMRSDQPPQHHRHHHREKPAQCGSTATGTDPMVSSSVASDGTLTLAEACSGGDIGTVRKLLTEGRSIHETSEEGESLLSLACSAGYYELAQVLLAMHASVEDRGIKGDCTPLMEAASVGHVDIVRLLIAHGADVNAVSGSGNTPLMYACAGGHEECVRALLQSGANVEEHNENGHTPLMEAASAGHVGVAKILLEHGAGINTHSNEFKESALTLACCKGHLDMVRFLLAAGAGREHGTDEMHAALMEASMDGHVEVARLLLDSGAQVSMPTDSFESPLTLAACGGHVDLAMLLLERGAKIEEVNDEGYTPLMEAAREGHEEMVALLLAQGASINAQTEETQETALTLACCGGFLEVAESLIKAGGDIELGASTPLMEAAQEGHLELVRFLVTAGANVHASTQTGDTALTYACENGRTDVAELLLRAGARLEHESEGGRTPLMKACRASHLCTVRFLVGEGADVNRMTASGDHTPLSLACAGGHVDVVKFLLACNADPFRKLKDNSSTLIEAAKGGHTAVVQLLLDYPHSVMIQRAPPQEDAAGLTAAQAAQLGLSHVSAPGAPGQCTLVPQDKRDTLNFAMGYMDGWINGARMVQMESAAAGGPAAPAAPSSTPPALLAKHKPTRKQRPVPSSSDHHLPPPPDILDEQRPETFVAAQHNELTPETEKNLIEQPEATSVTTVPTTPPYPPPQPFPVQQAANVSQLQQLQQQQLQQLAAQQQQCLARHLAHQYAQNSQGGIEDSRSCSDCMLFSLMAYMQRNVPPLRILALEDLSDLVKRANARQNRGREDAETSTEPPRTDQPDTRLTQTNEEFRSATFTPPALPAVTAASTLPKVTTTVTVTTPGSNVPGVPISVPSVLNIPSVPVAVPSAVVPTKRDVAAATHHAPPQVKKKGRGVGRAAGPRSAARSAGATRAANPAVAPTAYCAMDVDAETDSNHDTALTLACAGGHEELVELLLARGADIEHRDKKGFTPLILAATAGHEKIVEILLNHGADIEAQSERTKDTPLSLACSGGRYEVVELLLTRGANKEHRNVSDYTPLSLAASGGYVNIIRLLLHHQAEINSRTGSRLGISPLMLAAMNGHTAAVRLLLDCGSDINAQIETNRNTALTLACFQGRHEVVSLLLDRKANVEHRAKTGLTPLMEAASGGYVEVGRVLLDKGADVNAPPVPSSRDTALTIAADKGHTKFVELLLQRRAAVEVKNKKGNSPLWLAANGGHLAVVEMLYNSGADIDSQDNRKVSCLMAAFRKGHIKVVKWMVDVVTQFPSDQEMTRYICTLSDKELLEKCQECVRVIRAAKETQAARANQNATILLEELESERCREENRRLAAARRREKKKKKKIEKKEALKMCEADKALGECSEGGEPEEEPVAKEEGDSGIDANSQGSCSSSDVKVPPVENSKCKKKKAQEKTTPPPSANTTKKQPDKINKPKLEPTKPEKEIKTEKKQEKENVAPSEVAGAAPKPTPVTTPVPEKRPAEKKEKWEGDNKSTSPKGVNVVGRREEGWKEVVRKSSVQTVEPGSKRVIVAAHAISRVIGRAGSNINAIRAATGAHIEVDKQTKGQGDRTITIKGSPEAMKQASNLIAAMIRDPEAEIAQLLPRGKMPAPAPMPLQPKTPKQPAPKQVAPVTPAPASRAPTVVGTSRTPSKTHATPPRPTHVPPRMQTTPVSMEKRAPSAGTTPIKAGSTSTSLTYTGAIVGARSHTFASKVAPHNAQAHTTPQSTPVPSTPAQPTPLGVATMPVSPGKVRASPAPSAAANVAAATSARADDEPARPASHPLQQLSPESNNSWSNAEENPAPPSAALHINTTPQQMGSSGGGGGSGPGGQYSLFGGVFGGVALWGNHDDLPTPHQPHNMSVDASKAPGYRGGCSPSSRTSSHGSTPPPAYLPPAHHAHHALGNTVNAMDLSGMSRNGPIYQDNSRNGHNMMAMSNAGVVGSSLNAMGSVGMSSSVNVMTSGVNPMNSSMNMTTNVPDVGPVGSSVGPVGSNVGPVGSSVGPVGSAMGANPLGGLGYAGVESRLNPRAPDFPHHKHNPQLFTNTTPNINNLLLSYQQQAHKPIGGGHPYQSLLDRGVGPVGSMGPVGSLGPVGLEEERKPRPIGTERAWKMTAPDDWTQQPYHMQEHDRYQNMNMGGPEFGGALSMMQAPMPVYMPPQEPPHWDQRQPHPHDKQNWNKWTH